MQFFIKFNKKNSVCKLIFILYRILWVLGILKVFKLFKIEYEILFAVLKKIIAHLHRIWFICFKQMIKRESCENHELSP